MKIYLDVCCLNRPFDDQTDERIHLESEAIITILSYCQYSNWELIGSFIADYEISLIPDEEKRKNVTLLAAYSQDKIDIDGSIIKRANKLKGFGIKLFDALHLASAESGKSDVFLTTDDKLLKTINKNNIILDMRVDNLLKWLLEVIQNGRSHHDTR